MLDEESAGRAARWWLHHSLAALDRSLRDLGSRLVLRRGPRHAVLAELANECGATHLFFTRRCEPSSRREEAELGRLLDGRLEVEAHDGALLTRPDTLLTGRGTPYRVFTPFWKAAIGGQSPPAPHPAPAPQRFAGRLPASLEVDELGLLPTQTGGLADSWQPGEASATRRLDALAATVGDYARGRDLPGQDATSRLSPHLAFGEIGIRRVWHTLQRLGGRDRTAQGAETLQRQLYWREFCSYLLWHFPSLPAEPLREEFRRFRWSDDDAGFRAWRRGMTGYPVVDAGMRQLRATGWMHNRVRMIAASFLVKDLLIPWQHGAAWFLDRLVDADLANNSVNWQWVAGCGTDAAPYFRVFNPALQGRKYDPEGEYVRRWVPEIADLPDKVVHEPWKAATRTAYPEPIVDHAAARQRALARFRSLRSAT